jgi:hypothetical protein
MSHLTLILGGFWQCCEGLLRHSTSPERGLSFVFVLLGATWTYSGLGVEGRLLGLIVMGKLWPCGRPVEGQYAADPDGRSLRRNVSPGDVLHGGSLLECSV